jgi:hypothetical protein
MKHMKTEIDRLWPALFHGWVELLTLLLLLFIVLSLWGWALNRGLRPADRGPSTPWPVLLLAFGLVLLLRFFHEDMTAAMVVAGALLLAGWIARVARARAMWIPAMLLAALLGLGWMLSAIAMAVAGFIVFLLSAKRS